MEEAASARRRPVVDEAVVVAVSGVDWVDAVAELKGGADQLSEEPLYSVTIMWRERG